jgi:hypothetical protein
MKDISTWGIFTDRDGPRQRAFLPTGSYGVRREPAIALTWMPFES